MIPIKSLDNKRTKVCINCKIEKSINEFGKKAKVKGGISNVCKECNRALFREYYSKNKDVVLTKNKQYYKDNIDKYKEYQKYYAPLYRNTEHGRNVKRTIDHNRRIKLLGRNNDGTVTQFSIDELLIRQNHVCVYCKKNITDSKDGHLDHIYPLAKGGTHSIANVQWLCVTCNLRKNCLLESEFIKLLGGNI